MTDRKVVIATLIFGVLLGAVLGIAYSRYVQAPTLSYEVYFSPKGGCADAVLFWIGRANQSVHVLMFIFTLDAIADALISAHRRGVEVRVVFDKAQSYSQYAVIRSAGIEVRNDTNWEGIMHDKIAIIDYAIVITGSFNWTNTAENNNNENLIVIHSVEVASRYESEFQKIWSQSQG